MKVFLSAEDQGVQVPGKIHLNFEIHFTRQQEIKYQQSLWRHVISVIPAA